MKAIALIAAAGSLSVMAAPASAAQLTPQPAPFSAQASEWNAQWLVSPEQYGPDRWDDYDDDDWHDRRRDRRYDRRGRGHGRADYDRNSRYIEPRRISRGDRVWRGRDGRVYCERDNGTTGLVIGAGVGALLGRTIDTRGDRTVGTLLGGALGAVLGREIDRGEVRCR